MAPRKGRGGNGKDEIGLDSIEEDRIGLGSKVEPVEERKWKGWKRTGGKVGEGGRRG